MRFIQFAIVTFLFAALAPAFAQAPRALSVDDELDRIVPRQPAISPDGTSVVYVQAELNWKENRRDTHLVRVDVVTGEAANFTRGTADRAPAWSPDGSALAFLRKTEIGTGEDQRKVDQIWVISASGGEAFQVTKLSDGVMRFVWAPDNQSILFVATDPVGDEERKRRKDGDDAIFVYEGPNGQGRARWSNVWTVALADRKSRQVTQGAMRVSALDVSPDGTHVAVVYRRENGRNSGNLAEIGLVRVDNGSMTRLTDNEAPESRVRFTPDGRRVAYLAPDGAGWELRQDRLFVLDLETRRHEFFSDGFEFDIRDFRFRGERAVVSAGARTDVGIYELGDDTRELFRMDGVATDVSWSRDGSRAAFVWSRATSPPEIAISELGAEPALAVLTDLNPQIQERALSTVEIVRWKSRDGLEIEGLLYRPHGADPSSPTPLILEIHGGPAGVFTRSWRADRHIYGGLGYAVLAPNVRGSTAYGDRFLRGNMNDLGGGDYDDLMSGVDHVVAEGIADPEKLGVRGWSYGGILGGWVITHTDRFKAASLGAMVSDWRSEYGQGFNFDVRLWYISGDPWTNPEAYRERSALTHVQNVTTPTLLLHGEADDVDTIEQSMNFFNALWEKGTPTRFIRFPREGHGIREPRHQRVRFLEEIAWMQKHVRGLEWSPPEREPGALPTETP